MNLFSKKKKHVIEITCDRCEHYEVFKNFQTVMNSFGIYNWTYSFLPFCPSRAKIRFEFVASDKKRRKIADKCYNDFCRGKFPMNFN